MGFGIYSSIAGANAREIELEVLSNNVANIQTTGFKEMQVSFTSEVDKNLALDEMQQAQVLVREGSSHINYAQGSIYQTGNPLDIAIQGEGFFEVQTPQGTRYTRNGNFTLNQEGEVITPQGHPLITEDGPLTLPPNAQVSFSPEGDISVNSERIGRLKVVIPDMKALKLEGSNYYSIAEGQIATPSKNFRIAQSHLESSNVDIIRNLTRIIEVSRAYESHQKSITKQMDSSQQLNQIAKVTA
jgi:flagellar basal-body rod protein FlgF